MKFVTTACAFLITGTISLDAHGQSADSVRKSLGEDVTISAERPISAVSERGYLEERFSLKPRSSTQDLLQVVPGLFTAQHAGGGKAEQIFLRGFDADHGTDVNISVDGAPVNMVSHGHGQGYADLHFVIPETIERIDVVKGPYLARFGDLTTAGAVALRTRELVDRSMLKVEAGSYDSYRALGIMQLPLKSSVLSSYVAAELVTTRGYFDSPQDFYRWNLMGKAHADQSYGRLTGSVMSFGSEWKASGQVPLRAIRSGVIDRFGAINDQEGGKTSRTTAVLAFQGDRADAIHGTASFSKYAFQLFSDFTFFARDPIRGDMIEQTDNRSVLSAKIEKPFVWSLSNDLPLATRFGLDMRIDNIALGLYHDSMRVQHTTVVDADIDQVQFGAYLEQDILLPWSTIHLGVRADRIGFSVLDRTTGDPTLRDAAQFVVSPKASMSVPVAESTTLFLNSGFGFHSNDARAVVQFEESSMPRAFGAELGMRYDGSRNAFNVSSALWMLDLEEEYVYIGDEGSTEASGRTRRLGLDLEVLWKPTDWLAWNGELTLVHSRFRDEAIGFDRIPLAPTVTFTSTLTVIQDAFSGALDVRYLGDRPANESATVAALGHTVVDLSARYRLSNIILHVGMDNILNVDWNEAQFDTESRLRDEPESVSELHLTPGTPRSIKVGLSYEF